MNVDFQTITLHDNGIISALTPNKHRLFERGSRILAVLESNGKVGALNYDEILDEEYKLLESLPYFGGDESALGRRRYHWSKVLSAQDWEKYLATLQPPPPPTAPNGYPAPGTTPEQLLNVNPNPTNPRAQQRVNGG